MSKIFSEKEITEAYENEKLFVKCINTVEDGYGIICVLGKEYEVIGENENCWEIEVEDSYDADSMMISKDDGDFELLMKQ